MSRKAEKTAGRSAQVIGSQPVLIQFQPLPQLSAAAVLPALEEACVRLGHLRGENRLPLRVEKQRTGGRLRILQQSANVDPQTDDAHQFSGRGINLAVKQILLLHAAEFVQLGDCLRQQIRQPVPLSDPVGGKKGGKGRIVLVTTGRQNGGPVLQLGVVQIDQHKVGVKYRQGSLHNHQLPLYAAAVHHSVRQPLGGSQQGQHGGIAGQRVDQTFRLGFHHLHIVAQRRQHGLIFFSQVFQVASPAHAGQR